MRAGKIVRIKKASTDLFMAKLLCRMLKMKLPATSGGVFK
jgi:hypothetical protein